jgi:hypothetical protein
MLFCSICCSLAALATGCGTAVPEQFQREITPAVAHAESMRSLVTSLQEQLKAEGLRGVKSELITLDERLEEFVDSNIDDQHRSSYDTIIGKLKELDSALQDPKITAAVVDERIQELVTLADALPKGPDPPAS